MPAVLCKIEDISLCTAHHLAFLLYLTVGGCMCVCMYIHISQKGLWQAFAKDIFTHKGESDVGEKMKTMKTGLHKYLTKITGEIMNHPNVQMGRGEVLGNGTSGLALVLTDKHCKILHAYSLNYKSNIKTFISKLQSFLPVVSCLKDHYNLYVPHGWIV